MRFKKQDCPDISLSWEKVSRRITDLIRKGRYLTEQEQAEYDKIQEEKALAESEPELETVGLPSQWFCIGMSMGKPFRRIF